MSDNSQLSHYVSRSLTRPWEFSDSVKPKSLWYYDFKADSIGRTSSKVLFAEVGLLSKEAEDFFNTYIETPLGNAAQAMRKIGTGPIQKQWPVYRALRLIFPLQSHRVYRAKFDAAKAEVEKLTSASEIQIDNWIKVTYADTALSLHHRPLEQIYMPGAGLFAVPISDAQGRSELAVALPLGPHTIVLHSSKSIDVDDLNLVSFSQFSVGITAASDRVVFAPELKEVLTDEEIKSYFKRLRQDAEKEIEKFQRSA